MLTFGIFTLLAVVALPASFSQYNTRLCSLVLIASGVISINAVDPLSMGSGVPIYSGLFAVSLFSLSIAALVCLFSAVVLCLWAPSQDMHTPQAEYGLLVLVHAVGSAFLVFSADLVSVYISIELLSFALYILTGLYRDSLPATNAGLSYFLLGGLSSCFILLGSALLYSTLGSTHVEILGVLLAYEEGYTTIGHVGLFLFTTGVLFKVGAAPFHQWAPDVYDGIPTIMTTLVANIPKLALMGFLYGIVQAFPTPLLWNTLLLSAFLSLLFGTVVGLAQTRVKRLLTYSTVSHVGFILVVLALPSLQANEAFYLYLAQYVLTALQAFSVLLALGYLTRRGDIELLTDLRGFSVQYPMLALCMGISVLSIAGVPPMVGFYAKAGVLASALQSGSVSIALLCVVVSAISATYYLKVVRLTSFTPHVGNTPTTGDAVMMGTSLSGNTPTTGDAVMMGDSSTTPTAPTRIGLSPVHSYTTALLTLTMVLYMVHPSLVVNSLTVLSITSSLMSLPLLVIFIVCPVIIGVLLTLNLLLAPYRPDSEKGSIYECGFSGFMGQTRAAFPISYYLVAVLFSILDVEILLFTPLVVVLATVGMYGLCAALLFFTVLTLGFVYELSQGVVYFTDQRSSVNPTRLYGSDIRELISHHLQPH